MILTDHSPCYAVCDLLACSTIHSCCQSRPFNLTSDMKNVQTIEMESGDILVSAKKILSHYHGFSHQYHNPKMTNCMWCGRWTPAKMECTQMLETRIIFPDGLKKKSHFFKYFFSPHEMNSCFPVHDSLQPLDSINIFISASYIARNIGLATKCSQQSAITF